MNPKTFFKRYFLGLLDLIYPQNCAFCSGETEDGSNFCRVCNRLILESIPKIMKSNIFATQIALYKINDEIKEIIHDLKYHGIPNPAQEIMGQYNSDIENIFAEIDIITPVPLHWFRKLKRGYNQSYLLGETLSNRYSIPVSNVVKRIRHTSTQTKKTRDSRLVNITGAFRLIKNIDINKKRILLVDDVYTTGATTEEIARVLINGGAKSVSLITIAYA